MLTSDEGLFCETQQNHIPPIVQVKDEFLLNAHQQLKSDEEIARKLQLKYDKEYDTLKYLEKFNDSASSRIPTSDCKENALNTLSTDSEDGSEEDKEDIEDNEWDRYDIVLEGCKHKSKNKKKLCGDSNTSSGEPLNRLTKDFRCSKSDKDKLLNEAKSYITVSYGLNDTVRNILLRLIRQHLIKEVDDIIYIGKNFVTLHAKTHQAFQLPSECAIMIFTAAFSDFNNPGRRAAQVSMRSLAKKEMDNRTKLKNAGVLCPTILDLKGSALIMSYLGRNNKLAPKLKHACLDEMKYAVAYSQIADYLHIMYSQCNLVHGDLSENNIIWFDHNCYISDVSQSVEAQDENAFHLLHKDCTTISKFFEKRNVPEVVTADQLFNNITGLNYVDVITGKKRNTYQKTSSTSKPGIG